MVNATDRRTIGGTDNPAVLKSAAHRNNGRYNGDGREWETPAEVFGPLNMEFDFSLDPCATRTNAKCAQFFTKEDNGLLQPWGLHRVFMNPPYGREIYAWTKKAREAQDAGALVVGLLPASTDLEWWHRDVIGHAEVRYLRGRVRFIHRWLLPCQRIFPVGRGDLASVAPQSLGAVGDPSLMGLARHLGVN